MADAAQLAELRGLINEPTNAGAYTDELLGPRIDAADSLRALAATIWREKAARYAGLVDIKEGSSDRKLSQLHTQALRMASELGAGEELPSASGRRVSRTRPIERQ